MRILFLMAQMRSLSSLYEANSLTLVTCLHGRNTGKNFPPVVLTDGIALSSIHFKLYALIAEKMSFEVHIVKECYG